MLAVGRSNRSVWLLPIVALIAALMVLPAGAVLAGHTGASPASSAGAAVGAPAHRNLLGGRLGSPNYPASVNPATGALGRLPSGLGSSPSFSSASSGQLAPPSPAYGPGSTVGTNLAQRLAEINATLGQRPGGAVDAQVARLIAEGRLPARAAYLPSLGLLSSRAGEDVTPTYNVTPAPMGIADFGLGTSGAYTIATPDVLGNLTLNSYNASAGALYQDTGAYYWDGLSPTANVTPWQSGVQLNTVVTNVSYPGYDLGSFWTQNVVDFSGSSLQFIDNIWNFTSPDAGMNASTLYSYDGNWVVGEFYYAYGPTLPLVFPLTIDLYNNASIVDGRTAVTFGYRVTEGANVYTGIYDTVVFNSQPTGGNPLYTPDFLVSGSAPAYTVDGFEGPLYDAELVFGGPGGGSNAVIDDLNGTMALAYDLGGSWTPAPSAFDYGADTGETAIGLAGTWYGSTEYVHQGPSMLYGLWNTSGGVPSGAAKVTVDLSQPGEPSYGFVFVGTSGTSDWNLSYAPTTASGVATTWLPPTATGYNLAVLADGWEQANLASVPLPDGSQLTWYPFPTPDGAAWDSPIYLNGPAQAAQFASDNLGWVGGPYYLGNLTLDVNLTFTHLNDYGFPEFDLVWAYDSQNELLIDNVTQGSNTAGGVCANTNLSAPWSCYLQQTYLGVNATDLPYYGSEVAVWSDALVRVSGLTLEGYYNPAAGLTTGGGVVSFWNVTDGYGFGITSLNDSWGIWAASSPGLEVVNSQALFGASLVSLWASPYAYTSNLFAAAFAVAVIDVGGWDAEIFDTEAVFLSTGVEMLSANGSLVLGVLAVFSTGVQLLNTSDAGVGYVQAYDDSTGLEAENLAYSEVGYFAVNESLGAEFYGLNNSLVGYFDAWNDSAGAILEGAGNDTVFEITATNDSLGVGAFATSDVNVTNVTANASLGVEVEENFGPTNVSDVNATGGGIGVAALETFGVLITNVSASSPFFTPVSTGVELLESEGPTVRNVTASGWAYGLNATDSEFVTVENLTASNEGTGLALDDVYAADIFGLNATSYGLGIEVYFSEYVLISGLNVSDGAYGGQALGTDELELLHTNVSGYDTIGFVTRDSEHLWVYYTNATDGAIGFGALDSYDAAVTGTNASYGSIGVVLEGGNTSWVNTTNATYWSVGVALADVWDVHVSGVSAYDPFWTSPYVPATPIPVPVAAVVTLATNQTTLASLASVGYPALLYDNSSTGLIVDGANASFGDYGYLLNGSLFDLLNGVSAYDDQLGLVIGPAYYYSGWQPGFGNVVTGSAFVDNADYGVELLPNADHNLVYNNDFVGNNGATAVYNATHLQAYSYDSDNWFNDSAAVGNYWADWHSYTNGVLNPYFVSNGAWDYHPLGAPEGMVTVTFTASGLASGTSWSVTLDGVTRSSVGPSIVFTEYPGTYAFSVGAISGWSIAPASGSVVVTTSAQSVAVVFSALYTVSFTASGLPGGTSWSVVLNGVLTSGTSATLTSTVVAGTYGYTVLAPAGYAANPSSGTVTVGANYLVPVVFTSTTAPTYTVTIDASGLAPGTSWSAIFNGVAKSTTGSSLSFTVAAGSYSYQIGAVSGYSVSPASGTVSVSGAYTLAVTYTSSAVPMVTVTVHETGLRSGASWSAYVAGTLATGTGTNLSFVVPANGTYAYQIVPVAGYHAAPASGMVVVGAGPYALSVTFTPVTYTVTFSAGGLALGTSWSVVVDGVTYTSTGASVSVQLTNGTYTYTFGAVDGYSLSGGSGSLVVAGQPTGVAVGYAASSTPSYVGASTFNTDWAIALGLAALGVVLALVALLRRPRAPPPPATPWKETNDEGVEDTKNIADGAARGQAKD